MSKQRRAPKKIIKTLKFYIFGCVWIIGEGGQARSTVMSMSEVYSPCPDELGPRY